MADKNLYGLVEAGGTKFVLGVADSKDNIIATKRIATTTPEETMSAVVDWFREQSESQGQLSGIGVASFGPLQLDPSAANWGHITRTPKPNWSNTDLVGPLKSEFGIEVAIDTDVNGAALAEFLWGAGQGCKSVIYITIGTGIGGGAVVAGKVLHGIGHPEMGHMRVPIHPSDASFDGSCSIHGTCLEGLAAGPSILKRWGASLSELPAGHEAKGIIAHYLAHAVCNLQAIFEPGCIILGGGVMATDGLIEMVQEKAVTLDAGYFVSDAAEIVQRPALGTNAGLLGALALIDASA